MRLECTSIACILPLTIDMSSYRLNTFPTQRKHIPEIQGMRAIAVALVVLFHANINSFSGGYIGVDVFFVISGYLISTLLVNEYNRENRIDFLNFYSRRIKRLLPAALLVTIVTVAVFSIFYAPHESKTLTSTALASLAYLSNMWFAHKSTDYLGENEELDPLLHTWSLGVEEQFYIFWPALLFILWRLTRRRTTLTMIIVVSIASFILSIVITKYIQPWGFFSLPTRVWEFGVGTIIALWHLPTKKIPQPVIECAAILGAVAILIPAFLYTKHTLFPGVAALPPVIGTGLLLLISKHQQQSIIGGALSIKPMQYIGDISYSLYLWHWPVFVLIYSFSAINQVALLTTIMGVVVCTLLAHFTYTKVENPLRRANISKINVLGYAVLFTFIGFSILFGIRAFSIQNSTSPIQLKYLNAKYDSHAFLVEDDCYTQHLDSQVKECKYGKGQKNIVLLGDSHAAHWIHTLEILKEKYGASIHVITKSACPAINILPFDEDIGRYSHECNEWRSNAFQYIKQLNPDLVFMGSSTHYWEEGVRSLNFPVDNWGGIANQLA